MKISGKSGVFLPSHLPHSRDVSSRKQTTLPRKSSVSLFKDTETELKGLSPSPLSSDSCSLYEELLRFLILSLTWWKSVLNFMSDGHIQGSSIPPLLFNSTCVFAAYLQTLLKKGRNASSALRYIASRPWVGCFQNFRKYPDPVSFRQPIIL